MLNVVMFGAVSLSVNDADLRPDLGRSGRLLACYLFEFLGQPHRREKLIDLFWGELQEANARSAFNTAIWRIRRVLALDPDIGAKRLITHGDEVTLEPSDALRIDTHQLQSAAQLLLSRARSGGITEPDGAQVAHAVNSYRGPFLDSYDDDWVLQERERLHCLFVRSTLELMRLAAQRCDYEHALECARRILGVDALRESVQRDAMLLLVLNGQRAEALHAYQRLRVLLKGDLGIEPMPETRQLADDIHSGAIFENLDGRSQARFGPTASIS